MTNIILKRGTCSTCAKKERETQTLPDGTQQVRLTCRALPPTSTLLTALVPVPDKPGVLMEHAVSTHSHFPFVLPEWRCEMWGALSVNPAANETEGRG